jgi:hypothetical protein
MSSPDAPVRVLSGAQAFPYNPSTLETLYFKIPLELRHQIYSYVFQTPTPVFQKTIKGWRDTPQLAEIEESIYQQNGLQLLGINRRIREEALPVLYRTAQWRLKNFEMLREWLNTATLASLSHLHVRRVSLIQWQDLMNHWSAPRRVYSTEQGSFMISLLSDLPSLREVEISPSLLPEQPVDYAAEEWVRLMTTLRDNKGCLKITATACESHTWFWDWQTVGGKNFGWCERVMLQTSVEVRDWTDLAEGGWGTFDFDAVFLEAMRQNWQHGPLKHAVVSCEASKGRKLRVKFWGVPENVRQSQRTREVRKEAKKAFEEQRAKEIAKKVKGKPSSKSPSPRLLDDLEYESGSEGLDEEVGWRARKVVTREEAREMRRGRKG